MLVAPPVFLAPRSVWAGLLLCPWAAARPLAVRAASFARRVVSKPGQAPPPPTGTAAWPSCALHTGGAVLLCVAERVVSKPGQAPPPSAGTAAWPSGPSGALRADRAWGYCLAISHAIPGRLQSVTP